MNKNFRFVYFYNIIKTTLMKNNNLIFAFLCSISSSSSLSCLLIEIVCQLIRKLKLLACLTDGNRNNRKSVTKRKEFSLIAAASTAPIRLTHHTHPQNFYFIFIIIVALKQPTKHFADESNWIQSEDYLIIKVFLQSFPPEHGQLGSACLSVENYKFIKNQKKNNKFYLSFKFFSRHSFRLRFWKIINHTNVTRLCNIY